MKILLFILFISLASGLQIDITYDSTAVDAPTDYKLAIDAVVQYLEQVFTDTVTLSFMIGYGSVDGHALGSTNLGESIYHLYPQDSYFEMRSLLAARATTANDSTALSHMPLTDPAAVTSHNNNNHTYYLSRAQMKLFGQSVPGSTTDPDGFCGFSSTASWDYNPNDGIDDGAYDFQDTVKHEFSEVMGRFLLVGFQLQPGILGYSLYDLFHYSVATGNRTFNGTVDGYFSIDGGTTHQYRFNDDTSDGDPGDWASLPGDTNNVNDAANAFTSPGEVNLFSATDIMVMDVLGYTPVANASAITSISSPSSSPSSSSSIGFNIDNAEGIVIIVLLCALAVLLFGVICLYKTRPSGPQYGGVRSEAV